MRASEPSAPSTSTPAPRWRSSADWVAALAVLAFWLVARPYRGVRHDAILYLGQTFNRLMPERFSTDLFLHSSAQDRFSVFSSLMAPLIVRFGIAAPEMALLICCHVLFLLAVWKLGEDWPDRALRWAAVIFVAAMPHTYGGLGEFSYAEPFFTARSVAEPLALLALWQLLRSRLVPAIALIVLAAAFHPLVALPAILVGWLVLMMRRRSWAWLGLLFAVPLLFAALGIAPFDGLARSFDTQWYEAIRRPNAQVFASTYGLLDWSPLAFDILVLCLLLRSPRLPALFAQLARATLAATVLLTIAWIVGADVFRNVLLTQLQLWRVHWLLHLLAMMALAPVLRGYWVRGWGGRWCAAALGVAGIAVVSNWRTGWACVLWALAALAVEHLDLKVSSRIAKGAVVASFAGMLAISAKVAAYTLQALAQMPDTARDVGPLLVVLGLPLVVALLTLALLGLLSAGGRPSHFAAVAVVAGVVFGVPMWDQRSDWQRRLEGSMEAGPPVFDAQIPPTASVYWDYDVISPWLLARRGSFFSRTQGSGVVFDRAMALEYVRRNAVMDGVLLQRDLCLQIRASGAPSARELSCAVTAPVVAEACHAVQPPDYLVFEQPMAVPPFAEWHDMSVADPARRKSFYLYSCAQFR